MKKFEIVINARRAHVDVVAGADADGLRVLPAASRRRATQGMLDGLPVGVQVVGKRGTDAQLLRHAARMAFPPNPVPRISPA